MRKIIVIAILLSYSIASFGVSLNYFYCCGKLEAVSLTVNTEEKDCAAGSKKGCCDNKTVTIKLKIDQKNNEKSSFDFATPLSPTIFYSENCTSFDLAANCRLNPLYERPPPGILLARNIFFCIFRI